MSLYNKPLGKPRPRLGGFNSDLPPDVKQHAQTVIEQSALPVAAPGEPAPAQTRVRTAVPGSRLTVRQPQQSDSPETARSRRCERFCVKGNMRSLVLSAGTVACWLTWASCSRVAAHG